MHAAGTAEQCVHAAGAQRALALDVWFGIRRLQVELLTPTLTLTLTLTLTAYPHLTLTLTLTSLQEQLPAGVPRPLIYRGARSALAVPLDFSQTNDQSGDTSGAGTDECAHHNPNPNRWQPRGLPHTPRTFTPSHLAPRTLTPSHPHTLTPSHPHTLTPSHLTSSHPHPRPHPHQVGGFTSSAASRPQSLSSPRWTRSRCHLTLTLTRTRTLAPTLALAPTSSPRCTQSRRHVVADEANRRGDAQPSWP